MYRFAIISIIALFSSFVFAGAAYENLDADKNGAISAEEAQADPELANKFQELDKNQDNQLDAAEFAQFESAPAAGDTGQATENMQ